MSGWQQPIGAWKPPHNVFALIVDKQFPLSEVEGLCRSVIAARPDAVWVVRGTDTKAKTLLAYLGIQAVAAPLNPYWKIEGKDLRARWRDLEILGTCEKVLVAKTKSSAALNWWTSNREFHPSVKLALR